MSLKVQMDKWDYQEAVKAVQRLLNNIDTLQEQEGDPIKLINVPSASEIVDLVWDKIV